MPSINQWEDVGGLGGIGYADDEGYPDDWDTVGPVDPETQIGFGALNAEMGMIDGSALAGIGIEVDDDGTGYARTPMLEVAPDDYVYMSFVGQPYTGMLGMGDDGEYYTYDGTLGRGFFRRLARRIKKGVKKIGRRIKKGIKKVLKRSRFGRFLLKIGGKIRKIAMKIVRPLMKFVGKFASKLAPIAALFPGYGTAIAAGLAAAGKIAKLMTKFGVSTKGKKGKVRGLKLKNPKKLKPFQRALKKNAALMARKRKRSPAAFKRLLARQKARLRA